MMCALQDTNVMCMYNAMYYCLFMFVPITSSTVQGAYC